MGWQCVTLSLVETCLGNQNDKRGTGEKVISVGTCGWVTLASPAPGNEIGGKPSPRQTILENKEEGRTGRAVAVTLSGSLGTWDFSRAGKKQR